MTQDQLRLALQELNGERHLTVQFAHIHSGSIANNGLLEIKKAMLIPEETDHLVKVTDGKSIFIIDAERIAYIRIGL